MLIRTADRSVRKNGGTIKQPVLFSLILVACGCWGGNEAVARHRIDSSVRASEPRRRKKYALPINWSCGKINRLKCVRVKIKIVTVSRLSLFF